MLLKRSIRFTFLCTFGIQSRNHESAVSKGEKHCTGEKTDKLQRRSGAWQKEMHLLNPTLRPQQFSKCSSRILVIVSSLFKRNPEMIAIFLLKLIKFCKNFTDFALRDAIEVQSGKNEKKNP